MDDIIFRYWFHNLIDGDDGPRFTCTCGAHKEKYGLVTCGAVQIPGVICGVGECGSAADFYLNIDENIQVSQLTIEMEG